MKIIPIYNKILSVWFSGSIEMEEMYQIPFQHHLFVWLVLQQFDELKKNQPTNVDWLYHKHFECLLFIRCIFTP